MIRVRVSSPLVDRVTGSLLHLLSAAGLPFVGFVGRARRPARRRAGAIPS